MALPDEGVHEQRDGQVVSMVRGRLGSAEGGCTIKPFTGTDQVDILMLFVRNWRLLATRATQLSVRSPYAAMLWVGIAVVLSQLKNFGPWRYKLEPYSAAIMAAAALCSFPVTYFILKRSADQSIERSIKAAAKQGLAKLEKGFLEMPGTQIFVARHGGLLVGFIAVDRNGDRQIPDQTGKKMIYADARIKWLCVDQGARRQRVATRLIHMAESWCQAHRYLHMEVSVSHVHQGAVALYQSCGYQQSSKKHSYIYGTSTYCLQKDLGK